MHKNLIAETQRKNIFWTTDGKFSVGWKSNYEGQVSRKTSHSYGTCVFANVQQWALQQNRANLGRGNETKIKLITYYPKTIISNSWFSHFLNFYATPHWAHRHCGQQHNHSAADGNLITKVAVLHCFLPLLLFLWHKKTRKPASTDRTARRQFQATGQPVSRT